jgi:cytochrome c oxidase cbb3-type subunit 1
MTVPTSSPAVPQTVTSAAVAVEKPYTPLEIDVSCSSPLLLMFASAGIWLALGTLLNLIASIKLHSPGFFANVAWLSFGRVRPAGGHRQNYGRHPLLPAGRRHWYHRLHHHFDADYLQYHPDGYL